MTKINTSLASFVKVLLVFTIVLVLLHHLIINYVITQFSFYYNILPMYIFYVAATLLIYLAVGYVYKNSKDRAGMAFMALGFFKMMAAVLFLWPAISNEEKSVLPDVIAFFIPYFIYLFLETVYVVKILNAK